MAQRRRNLQLQSEVGRRLRLTREALDLRQHEFGSLIGMLPNAYSMVEGGKRLLSIEDALSLTDHHGLTMDWIYKGDPGNLPVRLFKAIEALQEIRGRD